MNRMAARQLDSLHEARNGCESLFEIGYLHIPALIAVNEAYRRGNPRQTGSVSRRIIGRRRSTPV